MAVVLVIIGGVGRRVLGESNTRFGTLATLQQNAATYRALQDQNSTLREQVSARTSLFPGVPAPSDADVEKTLRQSRASYELRGRVSVAGAERKLVARIESDYERFAAVMGQAIELNKAGRATEAQQLQRTQANPIADRIVGATEQLARNAEGRIAALVSDNRAAYSNSRLIFLVAAAVAIVLALVFGFAISSSLSRPVQRM